MRLTPKDYAKLLHEVLETTDPKDMEKVLDNFVAALVENNHLHAFDQIAEEYHKMDLAKNGIKQAEVVSARPLSVSEEQKIIEELNTLIKAKVEIKKRVDENIIGGVVIRVEDTLIDASVKNQLNQLKDNLINS